MLKLLRSGLLFAGATAVLAALLGAGGVAARRLTVSPPPVYASIALPHSLHLAASDPPRIPLPSTGSLVLETASGAALAGTDATVVRPTGSVAKTMTALVTLQAHPLQPGQSGPVLTLTDADVDLYRQTVAEHGSAVRVEAGERLSERQLLLALLLPSANNIAETLARWVSGGRDAFVARLNAQARRLGMRQTHFADPSGYSPATVSTAADLGRLGRAALRQPALMAIAGTRMSTLPDGTRLQNLDVLLDVSTPEWLGIKTGWTPEAGGCLLFAARQLVGAARLPVTLVGAVLGQPSRSGIAPAHPELGGAFHAALAAMTAAFAGYSTVDLSSALRSIPGAVTSPWDSSAGLRVRSGPDVAVVRGGVSLVLRVALRPLVTPAPAGTLVAVVTGATVAGPAPRWVLVTTSALDGPPWTWRLFHD